MKAGIVCPSPGPGEPAFVLSLALLTSVTRQLLRLPTLSPPNSDTHKVELAFQEILPI